MKSFHRTGTVLVAVAALVGSSACGRGDRADRTDPTTATSPQTPGYQTDEARTDAGITTAVQSRYYSDAGVRGQDIDVTTENGVLTLRGTVPNDQSRQQAENIARNVEGVTRVDNQLRVQTADGRTDEPGRMAGPATGTDRDRATTDDGRVNAGWLTTRIQAQYFTTTDVKGRNIDVTSNSAGVVTLRGEVENEQERRRAVEIAQNTDGTTRVEDHLRVTGAVATTGRTEGDRDRDNDTGMRQPDGWVTTKIQAKYFMDGDVRARDINVDTNNGVVTLRGAVRSEAERRQAVALARNTDGVRNVQDNLTVDPNLRDDRADRQDVDRDRMDRDRAERAGERAGDRAAGTARDAGDRAAATGRDMGARAGDGWITTRIQSSYFLNTDIRGRDINVDTKNGVVTLNGTVRTEAEKNEAEQIARETEGVSRVVNNLRVGGNVNR